MIEREVAVGKTKLVVKYNPETGEGGFGIKEGMTQDYVTLTNADPFKTMRAIREAFKDVNVPVVRFRATGQTRREAEKKDNFYRWALQREGYHEVQANQFEEEIKRGILSGIWNAPHRQFEKNN